MIELGNIIDLNKGNIHFYGKNADEEKSTKIISDNSVSEITPNLCFNLAPFNKPDLFSFILALCLSPNFISSVKRRPISQGVDEGGSENS